MIFQQFLKTKPPDPPVIETEPVVAYRAWRIVETPENVLILYSAVQDYCWPPYEAAHGDAENGVGLFAFKKIESALLYTDGHSCLGEVSLWGTVVEHTEGYRAEFAYPKRLFVDARFDTAMIMRLEETYGVPVEIKEDWPTLKVEPFHSSNLSPGLFEIISDVVYDHEPLKSQRTNLFCIPLGHMTYDVEGHAIVKDWTLTNMVMCAMLPSPNRFLIRGIRAVFLENGSPVPWSDPIYWESAFHLQICSKTYRQCPCSQVADPGIVMQNTDWAKIPVHERHALLSQAEHRLDSPGADVANYAPIGKLEGIMIEQQQCFKAEIETKQPWPGRSVLCALTGLSMRAVL